MPGPQPRPLMERLWEKVEVRSPEECWPFTGTRSRGGYGMMGGGRRGGPRGYAHRFVLEEKLGRSLVPGMESRHSCDNPPCCNPAHLFEGSSQENADDMVARGRSNKGDRHPMVKLTAEQVEAIRNDPRTSPHVAPEYGVSARQIRKIRQGTRWT